MSTTSLQDNYLRHSSFGATLTWKKSAVDFTDPDGTTTSGHQYVLTGATPVKDISDAAYNEREKKNIKTLVDWAQGRPFRVSAGSVLKDDGGTRVLINHDFATAEDRTTDGLISLANEDSWELHYPSEEVQVLHFRSLLTEDHLKALYQYAEEYDFAKSALAPSTFKPITVYTDSAAGTVFGTKVGVDEAADVGVHVYREVQPDAGTGSSIMGLYISNPTEVEEDIDDEGILTMKNVDFHWLEKLPPPTGNATEA